MDIHAYAAIGARTVMESIFTAIEKLYPFVYIVDAVTDFGIKIRDMLIDKIYLLLCHALSVIFD